jgi:hypothetical protein
VTRSLEEIALELLDKYREAEEGNIWEFSGHIDESTKQLREEVSKYMDEIAEAAQAGRITNEITTGERG